MEVAVMQEQDQQQHELVPQLQFAPGYRFAPMESELINYLRRKIEGRELPLHVINEVAILDWQPGSLVETYKGYGENRWFFFTIREPSSSNKEEEPNRKVRAPGVKATWKATGSVVSIVAKAEPEQEGDGSEPAGEEKIVVGTKRVLIYHSSDVEEHGKWSMHEYILKDHAKIGEYALCSIQRKQHSDTVVDDASEEGSSSQCNKKKTKATNVDPEKTMNKKRRTNNKAASTQNAVNLQRQEETTPVEPPLKPNPKTRRTATRRKNKASLEAEGQHQQKQKEVAPVIPFEPPLTPPGQAPPRAFQQEQMALAAYNSTPVHLPAAPLHGYPSPSDGMHGSSAPLHEESTPSLSFPCHDYGTLEYIMALCNQGEKQPPSFAEDSHAQYQSYQEQNYCNLLFSGLDNQQHLHTEQHYFPSNSTQNNSSWMHDGEHQIYQQETIGGVFGAQDQHANAQYHEQSYRNVHPYDPLADLLAQQIDYCSSSDQFTESVQGDNAASGSDAADLDLADDDSFNYESFFLFDDYPEDGVGTHDGSSPETLQSQGTQDGSSPEDLQSQGTQDGSSPEALWSQGEPVYGGQPSLACSISDFWAM